MEVTFWGTRGSIAKAGPTTVRYGGNTSCVSVRTAAGTLLVLDCGTGIHELGQVLARSGGADGHLLIGHTHWDHIQGLPFFAPLFDQRNHWHVYGPRGLDASIDHTLAGQMHYTYFPVQLLDFQATIDYHDLVEGQFQIDDVTITTRYLHHPALTLGFRIEADGATVVYATDHEPSAVAAAVGSGEPRGLDREDALHIGFVRDADLLIHDSQYLEEEYPAKVGWGHSTVEYAVDVAMAGDVARLALFHHDPTRTDDDVDALVHRARERAHAAGFAGDVFAAAEGTTITLRSDDATRPRTSVETATREPALDEVHRTVAIAVSDAEVEAALLEAASAEGFEAFVCRGLDEVLETVRTRRVPIVVVEAPPERSLDDLAEDARQVLANAPEGVTLAYVTNSSPPGNEIRPEITDWLVWPASQSHLRTKLRAWLFRRACRWQAAALPASEPERLAALWNLGILDTDPEARFDRYTEVACTTFDVPIALVSLVDAERQWFKSHHGIDVTETHRDASLCAHAVRGDDVFVVTDALRDDRFADNPYVALDPRMRFYAGVPLSVSGGAHIGTLCIMDSRPRVLDEPQLERLRELGRMVEAEFDAKEVAPSGKEEQP